MERDEIAGDAATEAFDGVRSEIALLRRAVERLAAEKADMPDYTVTLGAISRDQRLAADHIAALAKSPTFSLTPAAIGAQVEKVATDVRRGDRQMLEGAKKELESATKALTMRVASARSRDQQLYWVVGSGASGFVVGMLFLVLLAAPVARALPASWYVPEKIAAWTLGVSMGDAGKRLLAVELPQSLDAIAAKKQLFPNSRPAVLTCRKATNNIDKDLRCVLRIALITRHEG